MPSLSAAPEPTYNASARNDTRPDDVSLRALAATLLRHRALVLACTLIAGLLAAGVTLARPRVYSSAVAFLPQARRMPSGMAGIAAQFGVDLSGADAGQTPQFYVDLLVSRDALEFMVDARYDAVAGDPKRAGTLVEALNADGPTPALRRERAITTLRDMLGVASSPKTNVVTLVVRSDDPRLSQAIAAHAVEYVNRFNTETRQSQARAEREFTQSRRDEAASKLRGAENRLRDFELANRQYSAAPTLVLERQRLFRDADAQQRMYTAFVEAYERARLDEIRDTPVITVVSSPKAAVRPDGRGLVGRTALGLVGGAVLGLLIAALLEGWRAPAREAGSAATGSAPTRAGRVPGLDADGPPAAGAALAQDGPSPTLGPRHAAA